MNRRHHRLIGILILLLGLIASHVALAQKIQITYADPPWGIKGTEELVVEIFGSGFGNDIDEVKFLLPCDRKGCDDNEGGIAVVGWTVNSDKKITAPINLKIAELGDFDIRISSSTRGRGGKGTTFRALKLFNVKLKPKSGFAMDDITSEYSGLVLEEFFQPDSFK